MRYDKIWMEYNADNVYYLLFDWKYSFLGTLTVKMSPFLRLCYVELKSLK